MRIECAYKVLVGINILSWIIGLHDPAYQNIHYENTNSPSIISKNVTLSGDLGIADNS